MKLKKRFDLSIKDSYLKGSFILPGVIEKKESIYGRNVSGSLNDCYFSEEFGSRFIGLLSDEVKKQCKREIKKESFYSVGSSSRFAVASFCKNNGNTISPISEIDNTTISIINFEHGLKIDDVSKPQIDVLFKSDIEHYVEVKCHEIFDYHTVVKLSTSYKNSETFMKVLHCFNIDINTIEIVKQQYRIYKNMFGISAKTNHFDFKQFLCHLMGIMCSCKSDKSEKKELLYLFYHNDHNNYEKTYLELENEIKNIKKAFSNLLAEYNIVFNYAYNNKFDTITNITRK